MVDIFIELPENETGIEKDDYIPVSGEEFYNPLLQSGVNYVDGVIAEVTEAEIRRDEDRAHKLADYMNEKVTFPPSSERLPTFLTDVENAHSDEIRLNFEQYGMVITSEPYSEEQQNVDSVDRVREEIMALTEEKEVAEIKGYADLLLEEGEITKEQYEEMLEPPDPGLNTGYYLTRVVQELPNGEVNNLKIYYDYERWRIGKVTPQGRNKSDRGTIDDDRKLGMTQLSIEGKVWGEIDYKLKDKGYRPSILLGKHTSADIDY